MNKFFKYILLIGLIHFAENLYAQNATRKDSSENKKMIKNLYYKYNIKYPKAALENNIQGTVIVSFDVDSTCCIVNRKVIQNLGYGCDEEVLSILVKLQKDWKKDQKNKCEPMKGVNIPVKFSHS